MRDATSGDMRRIREIYCKYLVPSDVTSFEEEHPSVEMMETRRSKIQALGLPFIVATMTMQGGDGEGGDGGVVVGYAYAGQYKERSAYRLSCEDSVYVDPDFRRQGVGMVLLRSLLRRLKQSGMKQVVAVLGTREDNPGSFALHERCGFVEVGYYRNIGFKNGRFVDRVHMQACLDELNLDP